MIARVAYFDGQPNRFTEGHAYAYVMDAIGDLPGFVNAYHLAGEAGSMSVSVWKDEEAMRNGEAAVARARIGLDLAGSPPDRVLTYQVANATPQTHGD